jgi:hypothetical protein
MSKHPFPTEAQVEAQIKAARRRERHAAKVEPRVVGVSYEAAARRVVVEFGNGCVLGFPVSMVPGTEDAPASVLANVSVEPGGEAIRWDEIDADTDVNGLMLKAFNIKEWAARYLGSATSEAKARAARENGKKGGRPRGKAAPG